MPCMRLANGQKIAERNLMDKDRYAVMGIDPGGTTGIFACYVYSFDTVKETLMEATNKKSVEVVGNYLEQGKQIAAIMNNFEYTANVEHEIPQGNIRFAIEDFVLRRKGEGGATGNLTSCWVAAAAIGIYGSDARVKFRQASEAKTFATDARLKSWGLYERGSAHTRDATRHACCEINEKAVAA